MVNDGLLAAILAFSAVVLGVISIALGVEAWSGWRRHQQVVRGLTPAKRAGSGDGAGALVREAPAQAAALNKAIARVARVNDVGLTLEQAGLDWSPQTFVALVLGCGGGAGLATYLVTDSLLFSIGLGIAGAFLPIAYLRRQRKRRLLKFEEHFPEAIDLLARAVRAGHPLSAGFGMVSTESPEPVAGEFRRIFEEQRFGLPFHDALCSLADRVDLVDVRIFATAILVQREVGGNIAEILDKISQTIRARFTIRRQLRVYTAQGRMSGYVLAVIPVFVGTAMYLLQREYILTLFRHPIGRLFVAGALVLQFIGYLWIRRIVDIEI